MKLPTASIVIPTYNRKDELKNCLEKVGVQNYPAEKLEIVVVDGGSTDGTLAMLKRLKEKYPFPLKVIHQRKKGPANARNLGVARSSGEVIIFLDSDCEPCDKKWAAVLTGEAWKKRSVVGGRIVVPDDTMVQRYIRALHGFGTPDLGTSPLRINANNFRSLPTTNMAFPRDFFMKVGRLDEGLVVGEDIEFCRRAVNFTSLHYVPSAVVLHLHQRTVKGLLCHSHRGMKAMTQSGKLDKTMTLKAIIRLTIIPAVIAYLLFALFIPNILFIIAVVLLVLIVRFVLNGSSWNSPCFSLIFIAHLMSESAGAWDGAIIHIIKNREKRSCQ